MRFGYPIDISPPSSNRTKVLALATAEYGVDDVFRSYNSPIWSKIRDVILMIPSKWSIDLFQNLANVPKKNVFYLPHGYNPTYYYPVPKKNKKNKQQQECSIFRKSLDIPVDAVIYLNTGNNN